MIHFPIDMRTSEDKIDDDKAIASHDYATSDHCENCGAEQFESDQYYKPCTREFCTDEVIEYLKGWIKE